MYASNQQNLAELGASERPPMLEKGTYIPWSSRFLRFMDNKQEKREQMRHSIEVGPYERKMIQNPDKPDDKTAKIIEPISKITYSNKQKYYSDIKKYGNESEEGESLSSMYERLSTLVNVMERDNICPLQISINTKFLNSLQPERSKYVTMTHQNANVKSIDIDNLFDNLSQYEPHVIASRTNKAVRDHDPLALVAPSNIHSSHSHSSPSYSHSPQPYYVTHPSSVIDYEEYYQGEIQGDAQEDKLTTAMMLLAKVITQRYSTPTNNRLCTSSNTRNQAVIQDGRVDIQSKNVGYAGVVTGTQGNQTEIKLLLKEMGW
ncbi:hypothetical protein Tco_1291174 [Tanacetum coccineum]